MNFQLLYLYSIHWIKKKKKQNIFGINLTDFLLETTDVANLNRSHSMACKVLLRMRVQDLE